VLVDTVINQLSEEYLNFLEIRIIFLLTKKRTYCQVYNRLRNFIFANFHKLRLNILLF